MGQSIKQFYNSNGPSGMLESGGKARSQTFVLRCFLKVEIEAAEQTDNRRLFQREGWRKNEMLSHLHSS